MVIPVVSLLTDESQNIQKLTTPIIVYVFK